MKKPPCSTWGLWYGPEIEGQDAKSLGKATLFVRRDDQTCLWLDQVKPNVSRIWFCKEWTNYTAVRYAAHNLGLREVALEVGLENYREVPDWVYADPRIQIFFKVDLPLKAGDHVCVGPAFSDEAFMVGKNIGNKVNPEQYLNDICILP